MIEIREVKTHSDLRTFIHLPWRVYGGDPNWVPPLLRDIRETMTTPNNPLFKTGPHASFLAFRDGTPAGRILCGVNEGLNSAKGFSHGWLSLFESVDDVGVARAIFGAAEAWLRERGVTVARGPFSPTQGDDYRGVLVWGFDTPPVLMETYNPPYYPALWEACGYAKDADLVAYRYHKDQLPERLVTVSQYAMQRYGFHVDSLRLAKLEEDLRDIKSILDRAMPEEWADMSPPSLEDVAEEARRLRPLADPDLVGIARGDDGEPIGFLVGMPNYNEVLKRMNGRLFPVGWLTFRLGKRKVRSARFFILFVVPEWRKKAVTGAMFLHVIRRAIERGYIWGEGSTIGEDNWLSRRDAEGAGGLHYKTYRIYRKEITARL